ncbi:ead/Ea22-like family protein [Escherichia albertii]|uniref:ead/Ea22-like family protein n=1 Tax=Escherichia albertii TaxID=208962 RepID=UPI00235ED1F9|nr:ead/Ea22-like family protein [Escherichia albertii]WDB44843.1 ead/Ea22-like family protein [Escherichia albertii]
MSKIDYQALRERYSPAPVPKCPICGEEMSIQRMSGAQVVYACSGYGDDGDFKIGRTLADEHYEKSRVTVLDVGDPEILELLNWLETKDNRIAELEKIVTDYALKFQKAQDALKYAALLHSWTAQQTNNFTVSLPDINEYFINNVFQPLRYERDVERAIIKAGGKALWQEKHENRTHQLSDVNSGWLCPLTEGKKNA